MLTNTFADPKERAAAIGIWSAMSGMAVAGGPIVGGWLLEHFWWGSVFFINVPLIGIALVGVLAVVPESKDRSTPPLDLIGLGLSIAAITAIVFTIIEAPEWGWLSGTTTVGAVSGALLLAAFVRWELRVEHPMLPVRIFRNLRFSAASAAITSAFFALFGFIFLITQYFQLVRGYSPFQAGVRTIPVATESIMGSLSADKAGVGSAVNDTTRELGGTLGVAVIGSVFNSVYVGALREGTLFLGLPEIARRPTEDSVGAAQVVAERLPQDLVPRYLGEVSDAFLSGLGLACLVTAGVAAVGSLVALRFLPARAAADPRPDPVPDLAGTAADEPRA